MKTLIAIFFGICMSTNGLESALVTAASLAPSAVHAETSKACTLAITGYGNFGEFGRVKVTISAQGATCEEAANELRAEIIKRELRIER